MSSAGQGDDQKSRAEDCKALNLNADAVVDFYSELQKLVSSKGFPLILIQEDGDSIRWVTEGPAIPRGLRDQQKAHYLATSDIDLNELDLVNKFDGAITLQGSTKKEAERLATVEEWCRNHENQVPIIMTSLRIL